MREQLPPTPPPAAWAIFINGSTRTYTYLTEKTYSLVLTSRDLRVEPGENAAAILSLHGGQIPQLQYANGEWSVIVEYKKNYHEYDADLVPAAKWVLIDNLPPTRSFDSSNCRRTEGKSSKKGQHFRL